VKRRLAVLVALAGMLAGVDRPPSLLDVSDLRHWSYPDYTRIVIELSGSFTLKGTPQLLPPAGDRPQRLYLDVDGVWVGTRYAAGVPVGDGLLRGVRIGQNTERAVTRGARSPELRAPPRATLSHPTGS
jgi:N-acetylmuramoyl-L-alanine amidase